MSTRAQVRFATREAGQSFNEHPDAIHAQFYVHSDGYPEGLGLDIAMSIASPTWHKITSWEIESLTAKHGDLEYIYYIWQKPNDSTWISIFEVNIYRETCQHCDNEIVLKDECIFVGKPEQLITKYVNKHDDDE
jgi:hypothetical protein